MELYARDAAGNEARAQFEHRVFPKRFRQRRIELDDAFLIERLWFRAPAQVRQACR